MAGRNYLPIVALTLAATTSAHAQWAMNGSKIFYSDGKVGIGTTNPNSPLTVITPIGAADRPTLLVKMVSTDPEPWNAAIRGINRGMGLTGIGVWGSHDGSGYGVYGTANVGGFGVRGDANALAGVGVFGQALGDGGIGVFGEGGANGYGAVFQGRTLIEGNLGIGVPFPTYRLQLETDSAAKPTSNTWTISSDRRLKKDIKPIAGALGTMLSLRGVTYQWKDPSTQGNMTGTYTGMIAQDVEKVFPEWVREDAKGYKTLTVIGFEGIVVEALRELRTEKDAEIAELRAEKDSEIAELRAMMGTMQAEIELLKARQ